MAMSRYLGVDLGGKRTGLAIGDSESRIASPMDVIENRTPIEATAAPILETAEEYGADAVVLGLPLNMGGTEGPQAKLSHRLAAAIRAAAPSMQVLLHDERLTSFEADRHMIELELTRKKKKARQDAIAAVVLLRSFFEQQELPGNTDEAG